MVKLPPPIIVSEADPTKLMRIVKPDGTVKSEFRPIASEGQRGQRYVNTKGCQVPAFSQCIWPRRSSLG